MKTVKELRIVVASPSDVPAERAALDPVIEELNRGVARDRNIHLTLSRWETDTYPGFHPDGPQGLIDPILKVDECDVLIGIFWKRFGTPTKDAGSGTEHEFQTAYAAWKKTSKPHVMVYFNQSPYTPKSRAETDQWGAVLDFQERFPKEGLWWPYTEAEQFKNLVRQHLSNYLQNKFPIGNQKELGPSASTAARQPPSPELAASLRSAYLNWMIEQVRAIPLSGVDRKKASVRNRATIWIWPRSTPAF